MGIKTPDRFDPFTDRTARDIRNALSESFTAALAAGDPGKYLSDAKKWQKQNLENLHAEYIADRLRRYDRVFDAIREDGIDDPLQQALVIWNQRLFFEFHDHLETVWKSATGDRKQVLKGLIKAAGVYIHLEQHHLQPAQSLALKAYRLLCQYAHCLEFIANHETLLVKLKSADPEPPRLKLSLQKIRNTARRGDTGAGKESAC
jgi:hypothetical protein